MVSQRQWVPQWLICRKAKDGFFFLREKRPRHNGQSLGRYGGPRPTEVSDRVLNHRFPCVQKKKVIRPLQSTQNFLVV